MNAPTPMPTITKFERLMLAVAFREMADHQRSVRGLHVQIEKLAAKFNIDPDLWQRADLWIAETRARTTPTPEKP